MEDTLKSFWRRLKTVKIGLIGAGSMGERHAYAYKQLDCDLAYVSDSVPENAEQLAKKVNAEPLGYCHMLESDVEAVDICVPTGLHHEIVLDAFNHGKHVFCEKPLTYSMGLLQKIRQKQKETGLTLITGYLYNFHPAYQRLAQVLKEEALGTPHLALFRIGGRGDKQTWKHMAKSGGGALLETAVHMLDVAVQHFSPLRLDNSVSRLLLNERLGEKASAEDYVVLSLNGSEDVEILVEADLCTPSYMNLVEVHGSNGSFFGSILDYIPTTVYLKTSKGIYNQGLNVFVNSRVDLVKAELEQFVKVLKKEVEPPDCLSRETEILKIIEKVRC